MSNRGTHLIADLHDCALEDFVPSAGALREVELFVSTLLVRYQLKELGSYYHFFAPHAVTATVCLAESHLAFHSWPEDKYVSLDIFVCNRTLDSRNAAEAIVSALSHSVFHAKDAKLTIVERSA